MIPELLSRSDWKRQPFDYKVDVAQMWFTRDGGND